MARSSCGRSTAAPCRSSSLLLAVAVLVPALHLVAAADASAARADLCSSRCSASTSTYALLAVALDLVWGYCGILSLGHGAFFALGGYAMGMYLMRQIGARGVYGQPDAARLHGVPELAGAALVLARLRPVLVRRADGAAGAGAARLRLRLVRLPQPRHRRLSLDHHPGADLRADARLLPQRDRLRRQQRPDRLQGHPRLPDPRRHDARRRSSPPRRSRWRSACSSPRRSCARSSARCSSPCATPRAARASSATGSSTTSSSSSSSRPAWPASPARSTCRRSASSIRASSRPANSIEIVIWVAVGGRGTLVGPIVGAVLVNGAKSWFTAALPDAWLFVLGGLFVVVTLFLPRGIVGTLAHGWTALAERRQPPQPKGRAPRSPGGRRTRARSPPRPRRRDSLRRTAAARSTTACTCARPPHPYAAARARPLPTRSPDASAALPRRRHRLLRRLQGDERAVAGHRAGRDARHHRPERRRQDDDDGHHHRQDPARRRRRLFRGHDRPHHARRGGDRRARHRPEIPEADRLREPHRPRQSRAGAGRPARRLRDAVPPPSAERRRAHRRDPRDDPPRRSARPARRQLSATARSSGSRSACCWRRTRSCCSSTSRPPA